jgi:hypothetical protein
MQNYQHDNNFFVDKKNLSEERDHRVVERLERESWRNLTENLVRDFKVLWDKESRIVKNEVSEKMSILKVASTSMGVGGALIVLGGLSSIATTTIVLSLVVPLWAASLIVSGSFLGGGAWLILKAVKSMNADKLRPRRSIDSFEEISSTVKEKMKDFNAH